LKATYPVLSTFVIFNRAYSVAAASVCTVTAMQIQMRNTNQPAQLL